MSEISAMDLGRLKVQLRSQLLGRQRAEITRHRKSVQRFTTAALREINAATSEAQAYDALVNYTRMLTWSRGVPIEQVIA